MRRKIQIVLESRVEGGWSSWKEKGRKGDGQSSVQQKEEQMR